MADGPSTRGGRAKSKSWKAWHSLEHWKYPGSVGNDTRVDNINFNSHNSSDYAIERMDAISEATHEPFVMFEFMEINETLANEKAMAETVSYTHLTLPTILLV